MLSKTGSRKKIGESSRDGMLLKDLGTINQGLYMDKIWPRAASSTVSSRSKAVGKPHLPENKVKRNDTNNAKDSLEKSKKSIWSWKGIKALTHIRNSRFNCCFSLRVHSIEGLPSLFNDVNIVVCWKRKDGVLMTNPVRVCQGVARFEEELKHLCSVYGSRSGPHHSAKYEAKHFLVYSLVHNAPELDLGKHRVDLTRLLPLTLEELEEERSSGNWTTSFRLSGKARGATMNVSFGYVVVGNKSAGLSGNGEVSVFEHSRHNCASMTKLLGHLDNEKETNLRLIRSLPARSSTSHLPEEDIKELHEVMPRSESKLSDSVKTLYQKLDEETSSPDYKLEDDSFPGPATPIKPVSWSSYAGKESSETERETSECSVMEKGIEGSTQEHVISDVNELNVAQGSAGESIGNASSIKVPLNVDTPLLPSVEEIGCQRDEPSLGVYNPEEDDVCTRESLKQKEETMLTSASDLVNLGFDSREDESENSLVIKPNYGDHGKEKSLGLDDVSESAANEFLDGLGIGQSLFGLSSESEPDSPRERLLRQFEKEVLDTGSSVFNLDMDNNSSEIINDSQTEFEWETVFEDFHNSLMIQDYDEMTSKGTSAFRTNTTASVLEDLETEALMREWGLDGKEFQCSPPSSVGGFGSPIDMPFEDPSQLPPLGEGLGPFIQTKDGGFLRSMNPVLFKNAKHGGSLVMQVSNPVVVPAEMGSGITDILQGLASIGIEKLSMQANKLMPLEDITGKTMQQIAWQASSSLDGPEREGLLQYESESLQNISVERKRTEGKYYGSRSSKPESGSLGSEEEYVSLEDLAPLAMDKIEALSIEGLRIQSGMSGEDAALNISPQSIGGFSALKGKTADIDGCIGLDGTGGLQLLDIKDNGEDIDGLMGLSLSLDEWMKLDSGEVDDEDLISERTSKILAAHHATSLDSFHGRSKGHKRRGKGRKCGLLGNNFTVALMVQLRDPLRNYESVGTPMLALIQVERVFAPQKPKIYSTVSLVRSHDEEDVEEGKTAKMQNLIEEPIEDRFQEEEPVSEYRITEVQVAGLKPEMDTKNIWGSSKQQKAGSRWLLAHGMGKKNHPLMNSKLVANSSAPFSSLATAKVKPRDSLWSIASRGHRK